MTREVGKGGGLRRGTPGLGLRPRRTGRPGGGPCWAKATPMSANKRTKANNAQLNILVFLEVIDHTPASKVNARYTLPLSMKLEQGGKNASREILLLSKIQYFLRATINPSKRRIDSNYKGV